MKHSWSNHPELSTLTNVFWVCDNCNLRVGFNRPGIGEPFATESIHPDNIDDYVPPCLEDEEFGVRSIARILIAANDLDKLVKDNKITQKDKDIIDKLGA